MTFINHAAPSQGREQHFVGHCRVPSVHSLFERPEQLRIRDSHFRVNACAAAWHRRTTGDLHSALPAVYSAFIWALSLRRT